MAYATETKIGVDQTQNEIKALLRKNAAGAIAFAEGEHGAMVQFDMAERRITFRLPLPSRNERRFTHHSRGVRTQDAAMKAWEQGCRSRWRGLYLCIKAKLESIEAGIESFDDAFLAHIQLPTGGTVGDQVKPTMLAHYADGSMPPLLPPPGA